MWEGDEAKRLRTLAVRGIDFRSIERFDFGTAISEVDSRFDYGEVRIIAVGLLDGVMHAVLYTPRPPDVRLISMRRASRKEKAKWRTNRKT